MVKLSHHDMANFIEGMNLEAYFNRMACDGVFSEEVTIFARPNDQSLQLSL